MLSSWKEIAEYLGKGVRTVQRWERELHLPVRRAARNRRIIIAVPTELDAWIHQQVRNTNAGGGRLSRLRAETRAQRAKLVTLRAELARQRQDVRKAMDKLRSRIQRQR